ncbi:MAG: ATP synthase F1 subunit gamma [Bacteroidota bacterium]|nr:ATP synthase F1 subunit gamma [Candidatus Kapabacteria bacterium]MDW8220637.1 ATP synthase F1 subunit gamma [Bacteroidota bacterium]
MATLRDIRTRIGAVKNIAKITSAMKMVAVAKMRRAQANILAARPYAEKLSHMISLLAADQENLTSPLFEQRKDIRNIALIVVSADRGLCGGFNANVLRSAQQHLKKLSQDYPQATPHLITIGKRATEFFAKREITLDTYYPGVFQKLDFSQAQAIGRFVVQRFLDGQYDKVQIIVNEFRSIIKQEVVIHDFLPISPTQASYPTSSTYAIEYIYEPSQAEVLNDILPKHLNMQIWRAMLESNAAEQAARMMAMDNATRNAKELNRVLTLTYNKLRQAAITKEILEVVGGAEALRAE